MHHQSTPTKCTTILCVHIRIFQHFTACTYNVEKKKRKNILLLPGIELWIVQSTWSETQLVIKKEIHLNSINLRKILLHELSQIICM